MTDRGQVKLVVYGPRSQSVCSEARIALEGQLSARFSVQSQGPLLARSGLKSRAWTNVG